MLFKWGEKKGMIDGKDRFGWVFIKISRFLIGNGGVGKWSMILVKI